MKRLISLFISIMLVTLAFTACAKKDADIKEPVKNETTETNKSESNAEEKKNSADAANNENSTNTVEPDKSYENGNTEMSNFESLVDTFNNSENEEEREAARIELEKILKQAEQQAQ